ncbi:MAG: hypothetical protein L3J18_12840 [Candidatus Brocadia sp.]|uniref:Uncharacterized protein n=1 Tax=Candidatus Brocadia fulgida TaxID=380242 RepID=A0A0M2UXJ6_9BACT|nr:MAG: hypothetical protein BROFUL_00706 [Candidatus Brocadia fulgida]UJS19780.1 MAG: hypothetical protein L3J18_12840 [Candidatus Brocadia sp.]
MRGILFITLSACILFGLFGIKNAESQSDGQQVMKELDDFQKALSGWMKGLDTLGSQFAAMQKSVGDSLTPLKELEKTFKGNEEKLNSIVSRLEGIEKSSSASGVKELLDSFGKTLDIIKKLLSDLTKRVEDQEVKTAVLEKRYQEAQRPLDPIKKAIEDLNKLVTDKLGEQEKRIASAEGSIKTRMTDLDAVMKSFVGQSKTISDLEMRLKKIEKGGVVVAGTGTVGTALAKPTPAGTETVKVAVGTETVEAVKERVVTPEEEGFKELGDGFYIRNVALSLFGSSSQITGEIKNFSDRDWSIASFAIRVYNTAESLLFTQDFSIKTFKQGEVRSFNEIISGYTPLEIARYEIITKRRY